MKTKLVYLGFVISQEVLNIDPEKVRTIKEWTYEKYFFKVRRFKGIARF
jgi:hypothetical protein